MVKKLKQAVVWIFVPLLSLALFSGGCSCGNDKNVHQQGKVKFCIVEVNGKVIDVEIADTKEKRIKGLSGREKLKEDSGMLFVFPDSDRRIFWMKDCLMDIDIVYIDNNRIIREIYTMEKESLNVPDNKLKTYPSKSDNIMYALEMNTGWFDENKVTIGSKITIK